MINEFLFAIFFTLILVIVLWVFVLAGTDILNGIQIAAEKRDEEIRKSEEKRQKNKIEQSAKQSEEWVNRRRRLIIAKGPEINKITRSVFGNIRYFRINRINGKLFFSTKIGDFSIYNALSKDYESLLGELEEMKKRREYMLANKVSSRTNIDSRLSKSYSRKSRSNNNDDYPTDDDINSVDGGPPSEARRRRNNDDDDDDDDDDGWYNRSTDFYLDPFD